MPQGLQVWNAAGVLILDTANFLGKVVGIATISANVNSSASNSGLTEGTPFWVLTQVGNSAQWSIQPDISVSDSTISWSFPATAAAGVTWRLVYGVY